MKNGKAPTRAQKIRLKSLKLDPRVWLIVKDCPTCFQVVHRISGETRKLNTKRPSAPTESPGKITQEHSTTGFDLSKVESLLGDWTIEQILENEA